MLLASLNVFFDIEISILIMIMVCLGQFVFYFSRKTYKVDFIFRNKKTLSCGVPQSPVLGPI